MNPWDERFKGEKFVYGTKPNVFLKEHIAVFDDKHLIACYAEGEGRNAVYLAQAGKQVTAYDYSVEGLQKARHLAVQNEVSVATKQVDLLQEELLTEAYDGAVMIFGHFAKDQQFAVLNKIMNSLKQGGTFLLEVYEDGQITYGTGGPRVLDYLYHERHLKLWAEQYEIVHFFSGEVDRTEGLLHTGLCKVVQLIVKKQ